MVLVNLSRNKKNIVLKIGGLNFSLLKDILKDYHFSFKPDFEYQENVWLGNIYTCEEALSELLDIEPFDIPERIFDAMTPQPETKFYRIAYNEEFLKNKPFGDYQVRAIKQGIRQNRLYLAHKMGLGKTFMMIGILNHLVKYKLIDKILILAPTESVINFKRELLRFATFDLTEDDIYISSSSNRTPFESNAKVVIMRYRTFLMVSDDAYYKKYKKKSKKYRTACIDIDKWGTSRAIVLDEAHLIKNGTSNRSGKALHLHKDFFDFRYLLSGTPYPKGVLDLYSQITFLDPNLIPMTMQQFKEKIAYVGTRYSDYALREYKEDEVKKFLKSIDKWIIREFTEDNIKLPEKLTKNVYVEMKPKQLAIYRSFISHVLDENKSKNGRIIMKEIYRDFPRISLAVDNPCILKGKIKFQDNPQLYKMIDKWKFEDHSKLEAIDSLVTKYIEESKRIIIWSGHPLTIQQLQDYYKKYKPIAIHGQIKVPKNMTKEEYRDKLVEEFKSNNKHKILIASYYMIARAVNITEATRAICFDRSWDFEINDQMSKRNHRIGTKESVIMNPVIIEHTIEERQNKVLKRRERLDKDLLKYDSLSKDEWKNLFEGTNI